MDTMDESEITARDNLTKAIKELAKVARRHSRDDADIAEIIESALVSAGFKNVEVLF